ncbi:MAG: PadR family transcriptional regulator [Anaerovoracaceae bacterium]
MAREKFQTLTEQMFYTLLCFRNECCGVDVMEKTKEITQGRVSIGPGTLYNLIDQFLDAGLIRKVGAEGRRINYILTKKGEEALSEECDRLKKQIDDYENVSALSREDD